MKLIGHNHNREYLKNFKSSAEPWKWNACVSMRWEQRVDAEAAIGDQKLKQIATGSEAIRWILNPIPF